MTWFGLKVANQLFVRRAFCKYWRNSGILGIMIVKIWFLQDSQTLLHGDFDRFCLLMSAAPDVIMLKRISGSWVL